MKNEKPLFNKYFKAIKEQTQVNAKASSLNVTDVFGKNKTNK